MPTNNLAQALIEDHIVYSRLYYGLAELGLEPDEYDINLADTIFRLMKFRNSLYSEKRFSDYLYLVEKMNGIKRDCWHQNTALLANKAYALLLNWKKQEKQG